MRYFAPFLGFLLLSAAAVSEPATAQPNRARQGVQSGEVRSLDQILNGIRRERPGSLADVEGPSIGPSGEPHYRLKWLTPDGRVLWLDTDARTGRVLGVQGDDRGPPRGAAPAPRGAQGQAGPRPNFRAPADDYDFGAPTIRPPRAGTPSRRPSPEQNFAPGRQPDFYRPPPDFRRGPPPPPDFRRGPPPPQGLDQGPPPQQRFDRGPPPPDFRRGPPPPQGLDRGPPPPQQRFDRGPPPQQRFDRGREPNRGSFDQGAPNPPRAAFSRGNSVGGGGAMGSTGRARMPDGQPRGPRRSR